MQSLADKIIEKLQSKTLVPKTINFTPIKELSKTDLGKAIYPLYSHDETAIRISATVLNAMYSQKSIALAISKTITDQWIKKDRNQKKLNSINSEAYKQFKAMSLGSLFSDLRSSSAYGSSDKIAGVIELIEPDLLSLFQNTFGAQTLADKKTILLDVYGPEKGSRSKSLQKSLERSQEASQNESQDKSQDKSIKTVASESPVYVSVPVAVSENEAESESVSEGVDDNALITSSSNNLFNKPSIEGTLLSSTNSSLLESSTNESFNSFSTNDKTVADKYDAIFFPYKLRLKQKISNAELTLVEAISNNISLFLKIEESVFSKIIDTILTSMEIEGRFGDGNDSMEESRRRALIIYSRARSNILRNEKAAYERCNSPAIDTNLRAIHVADIKRRGLPEPKELTKLSWFDDEGKSDPHDTHINALEAALTKIESIDASLAAFEPEHFLKLSLSPEVLAAYEFLERVPELAPFYGSLNFDRWSLPNLKLSPAQLVR